MLAALAFKAAVPKILAKFRLSGALAALDLGESGRAWWPGSEWHPDSLAAGTGGRSGTLPIAETIAGTIVGNVQHRWGNIAGDPGS